MTNVDLDMLRTIFDRGLSSGIGTADGQVCIEAAIALASGEGMSEAPSCSAAADINVALTINDGPWFSPEARAEALPPIALAQIGTKGLNRRAWVGAVLCSRSCWTARRTRGCTPRNYCG